MLLLIHKKFRKKQVSKQSFMQKKSYLKLLFQIVTANRTSLDNQYKLINWLTGNIECKNDI